MRPEIEASTAFAEPLQGSRRASHSPSLPRGLDERVRFLNHLRDAAIAAERRDAVLEELIVIGHDRGTGGESCQRGRIEGELTFDDLSGERPGT